MSTSSKRRGASCYQREEDGQNLSPGELNTSLVKELEGKVHKVLKKHNTNRKQKARTLRKWIKKLFELYCKLETTTSSKVDDDMTSKIASKMKERGIVINEGLAIELISNSFYHKDPITAGRICAVVSSHQGAKDYGSVKENLMNKMVVFAAKGRYWKEAERYLGLLLEEGGGATEWKSMVLFLLMVEGAGNKRAIIMEAMIATAAASGYTKRADVYWNMMKAEKLIISPKAYGHYIRAYWHDSNKDYDTALEIWNQAIDGGIIPSSEGATAVLDIFAALGDIPNAEATMQILIQKYLDVDDDAAAAAAAGDGNKDRDNADREMKGYVAALAKVYSLKGMKEQAVSLFTPKAKGGRRIGFHPDRRMVGYLLKAHASIGDAEGVRFWLNFQEDLSLPSNDGRDERSSEWLINALSNAHCHEHHISVTLMQHHVGDLDAAYRHYQIEYHDRAKRFPQPTIFRYLLRGAALKGDSAFGLKVLREMIRRSVRIGSSDLEGALRSTVEGGDVDSMNKMY
eukprot:jgi/Bigna1/75612/fgenesh1_pg.35_\